MKRIEEMSLWERLYFPEIIRGLTVTGYRFWRNLTIHFLQMFGLAKNAKAAITVQYPEERLPYPDTYRGRHRLTLKEDGAVQCTACFLCATACPAHCIDIIGVESPWPDREKYPESFTIDELRCIYCGMCEEACPVDAIELTSLYNLTGRSREEMIFDKEKLLSVYDMTKDAEPMKSADLGGTL